MRLDTYPMEVPLQVGAGEPRRRINNYGRKTVVVTGVFDATLDIEASIDDGATWFPVMTFIGAAVAALDGEFPNLRVNTTAYVNGVPDVKIVMALE